MNCFPCRGPACNSCGKFDRTNNLVARNNSARCASCGGRVDLFSGACLECGRAVLAPPGQSIATSELPGVFQVDCKHDRDA